MKASEAVTQYMLFREETT